jgi:hypothetical protein
LGIILAPFPTLFELRIPVRVEVYFKDIDFSTFNPLCHPNLGDRSQVRWASGAKGRWEWLTIRKQRSRRGGRAQGCFTIRLKKGMEG